ncbi:hypothetical protein ACFQS6_22470 [Xanthomonas populi]|uniref:Uncharacterized protein n=1 Tax=Xanthomonas populi TaxID=53414 RepID=A0A2S7EAN0_9XANT|nr:hypothetical protein [Xanthomonas populi]PPU87169.1 hypothetical protein XpopCFBP1817_18530 [Xanthomonas populi]
MKWIIWAALAIPSVSWAQSYDCTMDCSGHEAGYRWGVLHAIDDPNDCGGNSASFIEGCMAYTQEQQASRNREVIDDEECADEDEDGLCDA